MKLGRKAEGTAIKAGQGGIAGALKTVARLALALLIVFALHTKLVVAQSVPALSTADYYLMCLLDYLEYYSLLDLLILLAVWLMFRYLDDRGQGVDGWTLLLSGLFALLYMAAGCAKKTGTLDFFYANGFQAALSLVCFCGFWALFCLVLLVVYTLAWAERAPADRTQANRMWRLGFCGILGCWLVHVVINYPCIFYMDGYSMVTMFLTGKLSGHHPPLSTAIMGSLAWLGETVFGDMEFGEFLYILLQSVVGALIFSYAMKKLYEMGAGKKLCIAGLVFFALAPPWGTAAAAFEKTLLYTEIVTLNLVYVAAVIFKRRCAVKDAVLIALSGLLAALLRKNGIYAVVPSLIAAAFCLKSVDRRRLAAALGVVLALYLGTEKLLYPALGVTPGSPGEALSIPLLQTANYVSSYPEEVTDHEREVISQVVSYERLETMYNPTFADPIKDSYSRNSAMLPEYFKVWFQMFLKHPMSYAEAFVNISYGYLAPVEESADYQYYLYGDIAEFAAPTDELYYDATVHGLYLPVVKYFAMPGSYTWMVMLCTVMLLRKKRFAAAALTVPALMNILVCIASPLCNSIRYSLATMAATPIILCWTYIFAGRENTDKPEAGGRP